MVDLNKNILVPFITTGAPNELLCKKKLFYSGYFAGKIDPVLCVAGKMKYIVGNRPRSGENVFKNFGQSLKILLKLWMFMMKRT